MGTYSSLTEVEPVIADLWRSSSSESSTQPLTETDLADPEAADVLATIASLLNNWTGRPIEIDSHSSSSSSSSSNSRSDVDVGSPFPGTPATPLDIATVVDSCVAEVQALAEERRRQQRQRQIEEDEDEDEDDSGEVVYDEHSSSDSSPSVDED